MSEKRSEASRANGRLGGRPSTGKTPVRQLGRVDDATWEALQEAAREAGQSWTGWAVAELRKAAKRQAKRRTKDARKTHQ